MAIDIDSTPWRKALTSVRVWALRVFEFASVQAVVQLLSAIAGLLIVRVLPKSDYALFGIANSMQTACQVLAELGTSIGFQSIAGRVYGDRQRLGALLNATLRLRRQFAVLSFAVCVPVTAWLLATNGASESMIVALCAVLLVGAVPLLASTVLVMVPQLHGEYRKIQALHLGGASLRCLLIAALAVTRMNALLATAVGALGNWLHFILLRRWVDRHADSQARPNADDRRHMLALSRRSLPNTVFFCLQGQVTLLILTFLGTAREIADITALTRLSVLLSVCSAVFANVFIPRFARCQDPRRLPTLYLSLTCAASLMAAPFAVVAWVFPQVLLWLLGEKYDALGSECGWVVTTACVALVLDTMLGLNYSKAWVRLQAMLFIPCILVAQGIAAMALDLRDFHDVVVFGFVTASATFPLYLGDALLGISAARETCTVES